MNAFSEPIRTQQEIDADAVGLTALNIAIEPVSPDLKAEAYFWARAAHDCGASIVYLGKAEKHMWRLGLDTVVLKSTPPIVDELTDYHAQRKIRRYMAKQAQEGYEKRKWDKAAVI